MRAVIVNPTSASGRTARRWRRIVAALEQHSGEQLDVHLTTAPEHATQLARTLVTRGTHGLVVLGGDGTIGEVVAGCLQPDGTQPLAPDIVLGIVHQGTGGDIARGLGLPKQEAEAIEVAAGGTPRRVDVGVARFRTSDDGSERVRGFMCCANVGMAADVVERVTGRLKQLGNRGAFAAATVMCLARNRRRELRLHTDEGLETSVDIVDLVACNNTSMGGGMLVAPDAQLDDGLFDLVVIGAAGRMRLLRTFPKIYSGAHVRDPLVRVERTRGVSVDVALGRPPEGVVLDGDLVGRTPARFELLAGALSVRVPGAAPARV